jgi:hypothetical protein
MTPANTTTLDIAYMPMLAGPAVTDGQTALLLPGARFLALAMNSDPASGWLGLAAGCLEAAAAEMWPEDWPTQGLNLEEKVAVRKAGTLRSMAELALLVSDPESLPVLRSLARKVDKLNRRVGRRRRSA